MSNPFSYRVREQLHLWQRPPGQLCDPLGSTTAEKQEIYFYASF